MTAIVFFGNYEAMHFFPVGPLVTDVYSPKLINRLYQLRVHIYKRTQTGRREVNLCDTQAWRTYTHIYGLLLRASALRIVIPVFVWQRRYPASCSVFNNDPSSRNLPKNIPLAYSRAPLGRCLGFGIWNSRFRQDEKYKGLNERKRETLSSLRGEYGGESSAAADWYTCGACVSRERRAPS